jgi:hypothetical protein
MIKLVETYINTYIYDVGNVVGTYDLIDMVDMLFFVSVFK